MVQGRFVYRRTNTVKTSVEDGALSGMILNPESENIQMAFAVVDRETLEPLDDPDYVEWEASLRVGKEDKASLDMRKCNKNDFDKFNPINPTDLKNYNKLLANDAFYCIDKFDLVNLFGQEGKDLQKLDV